jgi:hypothetical protein
MSADYPNVVLLSHSIFNKIIARVTEDHCFIKGTRAPLELGKRVFSNV